MKKYEDEYSIVTSQYLKQFDTILNEMIELMSGAELNNSISHNFIVQMIPHHRAAIEMSRNLLQYTTCIPLQNIALNIIKGQTESINNMNAILNHCSMLTNTEKDITLSLQSYERITQTMFHRMRKACTTNDIDSNFMNEMIPHHMGAIKLSKNTLRFPICRDLVSILESIIESQQNGVRKMNCLLSCCVCR